MGFLNYITYCNSFPHKFPINIAASPCSMGVEVRCLCLVQDTSIQDIHPQFACTTIKNILYFVSRYFIYFYYYYYY